MLAFPRHLGTVQLVRHALGDSGKERILPKGTVFYTTVRGDKAALGEADDKGDAGCLYYLLKDSMGAGRSSAPSLSAQVERHREVRPNSFWTWEMTRGLARVWQREIIHGCQN